MTNGRVPTMIGNHSSVSIQPPIVNYLEELLPAQHFLLPYLVCCLPSVTGPLRSIQGLPSSHLEPAAPVGQWG
jgi:hypothetical protein